MKQVQENHNQAITFDPYPPTNFSCRAHWRKTQGRIAIAKNKSSGTPRLLVDASPVDC